MRVMFLYFLLFWSNHSSQFYKTLISCVVLDWKAFSTKCNIYSCEGSLSTNIRLGLTLWQIFCICNGEKSFIKAVSEPSVFLWHHDTQHNDTQNNGIQHYNE
jgi:hypothetical protein